MVAYAHRPTEQPHAALSPVAGGYAFASSYDAGLIAALKATVPAGARKFDAATKRWIVAAQYGGACAKLARQHLGVTITVPATATPTTELKLLRIEYIGATKDRGDGESSAFGYSDGGWSVVFPENVLRDWFEGAIGEPQRPDGAKTLYAQLGVKRDASEQEIRSAYRRLARQWHPDTCSEPDAAEVFKRIASAYQTLTDGLMRRKYDAGLALSASLLAQPLTRRAYSKARDFSYTMDGGYRPVLRCGYILAEGQQSIGRFIVSKIVQWEDITGPDGKVMSSSWPMGAKEPAISWV